MKKLKSLFAYSLPIGLFAMSFFMIGMSCLILVNAHGIDPVFDDKIYIDETEMNATEDAFYIHTGENIWISTSSICKDSHGTFTYQSSIACTESPSKSAEYQKTWKCPYCYQYWPVGSPCQNKNCPSRYK
jgi:hypothetical protein